MLKINTKKLVMTALILFTADSFTANPSKLVKSVIAYGILTGVVVIPIAATAYAGKKTYDNRETLIKKAKKSNSYVSTKLEGFGNFLESKNLPGKWLVDGAKFGWNNKIAAIMTFIISKNILSLDLMKIKRIYTNGRMTDITKDTYDKINIIINAFSTLSILKLASVIEKYEAEQAKKAEVIAEVAKAA